MARAKKEDDAPPAIKSVGMMKKNGLYYVLTITTQGDKVLNVELNNDGDILGIAQDTIRVTAGKLFWQHVHREFDQ